MSEEQTTETQETTEATREDLIAAVREAGGTASVDVAAEEQAAEQKAPEATSPTAPAEPSEDEKIAAILKAREERHRKVQEAERAADALRRAAEAERERIIAEAKAEADRLRQQTATSARQQFERDPTNFLKSLADDPQSVVDEVVRQGTPEARALAKIREEAAEARRLAEEGKGAREELKKFREEQEQAKQAAYVAQVQNEFLSTAATKEKAPYLHMRYDPGEIFDRCNALCMQWQKDGMTLGDRFDPEAGIFDRATLVAYLEKQSRERIVPAAQPVAPGNTAQPVGAVAKTGVASQSANGMRTLSAAQGSERRTSPKPLSEMKPDEARAALIEEVAAARRANPGSAF